MGLGTVPADRMAPRPVSQPGNDASLSLPQHLVVRMSFLQSRASPPALETRFFTPQTFDEPGIAVGTGARLRRILLSHRLRSHRKVDGDETVC